MKKRGKEEREEKVCNQDFIHKRDRREKAFVNLHIQQRNHLKGNRR